MTFVQATFEKYWPLWQRHFSPEARLGLGLAPLAALAECTPVMASHYLSAEELEQWSGFGLEKRRAEWLGGRLAAKGAAARLLGEPEVDWQGRMIKSEADGRPYLAAEARLMASFISISHSGPLAAALAANLPCGLDIQQPSAKIHTVKKRFATLEEVSLLNAALSKDFTDTERLTLLWAAKEAVRKMVRISPLLGLLEIQLLGGQGGAGTPAAPLVLTFGASRQPESCPLNISVLCFFAEDLAWALTVSQTNKKE